MNRKSTFFWILRKIKGQIPKLIILILFGTISALIGTGFALVAREIINSAVDKDKEGFFWYVVTLAVLYIIQMLFSGIARYLESRVCAKTELILKQSLFENIIKKNYSLITKYHSGELMTRMTQDISAVSEILTIPRNFVFMVVRLICAIIVLFYLIPVFSVIFLVVGIITFFLTRAFRAKIRELHKKTQETEGATRSFWQEVMVNLLAVKVFSAEEQMKSKSDKLQKANFKMKMKKAFVGVLASCGYSLLLGMGYVFVFFFCGYMLINDGISFGTFTAALQLTGQVQQPFSGISGIMPKYYSGIASAERLMEIERLEDEIHDNKKRNIEKLYKDMDTIEFENVSFKYEKEIIFKDVSFSIKKGEFVAITGNSGIGKSTLFKLLLGVYNLDEGKIMLKLNNDERYICDNNTRRFFSYVPQGNLLFTGSIYENITFISEKVNEKKIKEAISISCADDFIKELPDGIQTVIGEKGLGLSEGQVQRLAIARAILSDAPILLLDEATSALDEETEVKVLENLRNLKNKTCIIVTHKKQALKICDRQLEIKNCKAEWIK